VTGLMPKDGTLKFEQVYKVRNRKFAPETDKLQTNAIKKNINKLSV
jgi:hypothetical protein